MTPLAKKPPSKRRTMIPPNSSPPPPSLPPPPALLPHLSFRLLTEASPPLDLKLLDSGAFDALLQSAASVSGGGGGVGLGIMPSLEEAECNGQRLGLSSSLCLEGAVALWRIRNERRRLDGIKGLLATTECLFIAKSQVECTPPLLHPPLLLLPSSPPLCPPLFRPPMRVTSPSPLRPFSSAPSPPVLRSPLFWPLSLTTPHLLSSSSSLLCSYLSTLLHSSTSPLPIHTQPSLPRSPQVLHYLGCHILWRVSTRVYEHLHLTNDKLKQLCECLNSPELRVKTLAAVTLWQLGLTRETLRRIPFDIAVRPPNAQMVVHGGGMGLG